MTLPSPMLLRSSPLPTRGGFAFEPKWDGFRALVSTAGDRLVVRSRRRWDMTELVPELADLPPGRIYDGELIAFGSDAPMDENRPTGRFWSFQGHLRDVRVRSGVPHPSLHWLLP